MTVLLEQLQEYRCWSAELNHEHHARQRDRANARNWCAHGSRRAGNDILTQFLIEA